MALRIVCPLELVDVRHNESQRVPLSVQLATCHLECIAVHDTRQLVAIRHPGKQDCLFLLVVHAVLTVVEPVVDGNHHLRAAVVTTCRAVDLPRHRVILVERPEDSLGLLLVGI